jgi:hypothetical protein
MTAFAADLMALAPGLEPASARGDARSEATFTQPPEPGPITERRRAAVLVTIVSDYGSLVERMTPVDAHRLVAQIRDLAVDAVRRHGGVVNQAIGEEIVSLFGVPAAHEDDELRAVRAALELHARVRNLAAHPGQEPAVQINPVFTSDPSRSTVERGPRRYAIVSSGHGRVEARRAGGARRRGAEPGMPAYPSPFVHTVACAPSCWSRTRRRSPFRVTGQTGLETRLEPRHEPG